MKIYRVTELANSGRLERDKMPWGFHLAAHLGTLIHQHLLEKYRGKGWYQETTQICSLVPSLAIGSPIHAILMGTPDMFKVEGETLRIIDFKTLSPTARLVVKAEWWIQITLYALQVMRNYRFRVKNISLEIWFYHRQDKVEDSLKRVKKVKETRQTESLLGTVELWIANRLKQNLKLVSFSKGVIGNAKQSTKTASIEK